MTDWYRNPRCVELSVGSPLECPAISVAAATGYEPDRMFRYFCGVCWNKIRAAEGAD